MNPDIFRKYDIRGIAETDLDDATVGLIGRAFGTKLTRQAGKGLRVGIGRDARGSSDRIFKGLSDGLRSCGIDVIELGMVPTPLVYFAAHTHKLDGAIQITGSHNPAEYNGFKMMMGTDTLHGEAIQELREIAEAGDFASGDEGELREYPDLIDEYVDWVKNDIEPGERTFKVALDSGNGVAGVAAPRLVREVFGCEVVELFTEPDASFPNHHPDPTVEENLEDLIETVREQNCDLGIAYDGDGDRIGVVDENGKTIWGDKLMIVLSRALLSEIPGATIIGEVKCSQTLYDDIDAHGGEAIMARVGHSLIKAKIKETDAELAGEMSGHIFFNDRFFGFDDALYTTCRTLEILSKTDQPFSALLEGVPETFATPELRLDCDEKLKFEIPGVVAKEYADDHEVNTIDGVRVKFDNGWGLVRASNTQPVLVVRVEAKSADDRDKYLKELKEAIERAKQELKG
ncbi:phosphomannomutase/phosphoglucomutase [Persicimonas caeni]|uniref:Phosphomannomutase/phosphoglucomutase n=1 Tax=Persicimonas caeni TaxID=2292766 RepID=A0A4Y6PWM8_PERCE|nr:phosphomannomutase/phosphoglucomutase [Persicimonas caeni]QDG52741.1 phosphomannomutase/phosphoglucomutase [Persicimonas caeni]QED33963.1 phosphomannomutase/phosphoglucomutase [Persicimonas caeni]